MLWGIFSSIRGAKRARNLVAPMYVCLGDVRQYPALLRNKYLSNGCYGHGSVPRPFQRTALANFSIAGDVEMVTNVTEPTVLDMILSASLRRKEFSFRRGTAMNDNQRNGAHELHTTLYSNQASDSGGNGDDNFDNEAPYGAGRG